jgi:hypothetical protein
MGHDAIKVRWLRRKVRNGKKARPVTTGLYPSTRWRNCVRKKKLLCHFTVFGLRPSL